MSALSVIVVFEGAFGNQALSLNNKPSYVKLIV